jgi:hypothetical protein
MLLSGIAVVWGWLFPMYRRFQTTNVINSVSSYMLKIDDGIYSIIAEGEGTTVGIKIDPFTGVYRNSSGQSVGFLFQNSNGSVTEELNYTSIGRFEYQLYTNANPSIPIGDSRYLKGPDQQVIYFVNNTGGNYYSGITSLILERPTANFIRISLDYRPQLYYWFDQETNELQITINIIDLSPTYDRFRQNTYGELNLLYNKTETILTSKIAGLTDNFTVNGTTVIGDFANSEQPLVFTKPGTITTYDVSLNVIATYITFSL